MTEKTWYIHDPQKALQFEAFLKEFKEKDPELYDEAYGLLFSTYTDFTVDDPVDCPLAYWTVDLDAVRIVRLIVRKKINLDDFEGASVEKVINALRGVDSSEIDAVLHEHFPTKKGASPFLTKMFFYLARYFLAHKDQADQSGGVNSSADFHVPDGSEPLDF